MSKTRFFSSQFLAYLEDDLWLENASLANKAALALADIFNKYDLQLEYPVEANELFVRISKELAKYLYQNKASFYEWEAPNAEGYGLYRFVTSCFTSKEDLNKLESFLSGFCKV